MTDWDYPPSHKIINYKNLFIMAKEAGQLEFKKSMTVEQFKAEQNISKLHVASNPKTGKKCLYDGVNVIGAVTTSKLENPVVSEVVGDEGKFFLLHNKGEGGLQIEMTL